MNRFLRILPILLACLMLQSVTQAHAQYYDVFDPHLVNNILFRSKTRTPPTTNPYLRDGTPVYVFAHRGVPDATHPENSVQSALNAMNLGIEGMELDVYESADHVPYLMHDQTLLRMTGSPLYSDIYRWQREGAALSVKTPNWSVISALKLCQNGYDGHGITVDHPITPCPTAPGVTVPSLMQALSALWARNYQGLIFLDLREQGNVLDVGTMLFGLIANQTPGSIGQWVQGRVVLKFQTTMFNGPTDYWNKLAQQYGQGVSPVNIGEALSVYPVYTSFGVAPLDQQGATSWALDDWAAWENAYTDFAEGAAYYRLIGPEVDLKAAGAILNYNQDDLFTHIWQEGLSEGVYSPVAECVLANPSTAPSNLTGSQGVYIEGGGCGPIVPPMPAIECGGASTTTFDTLGQGCTDHRSLQPFWYDTARFGFVLTDDPVAYINYLGSAPGVRPSNAFVCYGDCLGGTPPPSPATATKIVAADGTGTYTTIAAALAALPSTGGKIAIEAGTYHEKLKITQSNVTLMGLGSDASKVVIVNDDYAAKINPATGVAYGTSGSYTVSVTGTDFYASNLTIQNTADYEAPNFENNAQAVALYTAGDRAVYRAVMVLGGQDSLYVNGSARAYFNNCYVEGYVDYIFGNGKAVFDSCQIKTKVHNTLVDEATVTAQNRALASDDNGFVISNSILSFDDPYMTNVWLGRPWGAYSTTYFLNTKMDSEVVKPGWIEFIPLPLAQGGTNNLPTSTYREYNSLYPGSTAGSWVPFDLSQREAVSPNSNIALTSAQAAALAPASYLARTDGWNPTTITAGPNTAQVLPIPTTPIGPPTAPRIVLTTPGNGNVQISWAVAITNPLETGYTISAVQNGNTFGPVTFPANASSGYIAGLANGSPATVTLKETNALGTSPGVQVIATPVASAPSTPVVTSIGLTTTTATVNFTIASQGTPLVWDNTNSHGIYYALYSSVANFYGGIPIAGTSNGAGSTTPITSHLFTGLTNNTTYYVSLRAYNGVYSPTVLTPFTTGNYTAVPSPPTIISATAGNGDVMISWSAAAANPAATGFTITASQSGHAFGPTTVPANATYGYISGLTNGTAATLTLKENNSLGSSTGVAISATPVAVAPSTPVIGTTTVTTTTATVNFTIASQGSTPVWDGLNSHGVYYALYSSVANFYAGTPIAGTSNGAGGTTPITSHTFTGLTTKTTYVVGVRAYNGTSSPTALGQFTTN
jgi:hypothetical protein